MKAFIVEFLQRLFSKNPKFFKVLQLLALIVGAASAALGYLTSHGMTLPVGLGWLSDGFTQVSSLLVLVMAQMPNDDSNP